MKKTIAGIKDVAKKAGVALATADRVINKRSGVSERTRLKVQKAIDELNYKPNILARNLALKNTLKFAILLPEPKNNDQYWKLPLDGIDKAEYDFSKYGVDIQRYLYNPDDAKQFVDQTLKIINSRIDGLLLAPKFTSELDLLLQDCKEKNIPFVFIDSSIAKESALCSIGLPLFESGYLAGQLFELTIKSGEILSLQIVNAMDNMKIINAKQKGLETYMLDNNLDITINSEIVNSQNEDEIKNILSKTTANGIFIPNSKSSIVAKQLEELNKLNISLIGYDLLEDNIPYVESRTIDFLICQKPKDQAYKGVSALYEAVVVRNSVDKQIWMPLDVITKGNYKYYQ